ncbi:hypothetical protein HYALB_00006075 [Hymenoscyphus albidus]|uniref:Uncharacterized protein n=1 Tax=Hymenoscyphus albidus TaxID=595503 RepID=A0A9N9M2S5_9HELO|nr:hypothetical protein HYALB_00006075 [Hymenoscyphus albidus]
MYQHHYPRVIVIGIGSDRYSKLSPNIHLQFRQYKTFSSSSSLKTKQRVQSLKQHYLTRHIATMSRDMTPLPDTLVVRPAGSPIYRQPSLFDKPNARLQISNTFPSDDTGLASLWLCNEENWTFKGTGHIVDEHSKACFDCYTDLAFDITRLNFGCGAFTRYTNHIIHNELKYTWNSDLAKDYVKDEELVKRLTDKFVQFIFDPRAGQMTISVQHDLLRNNPWRGVMGGWLWAFFSQFMGVFLGKFANSVDARRLNRERLERDVAALQNQNTVTAESDQNSQNTELSHYNLQLFQLEMESAARENALRAEMNQSTPATHYNYQPLRPGPQVHHNTFVVEYSQIAPVAPMFTPHNEQHIESQSQVPHHETPAIYNQYHQNIPIDPRLYNYHYIQPSLSGPQNHLNCNQNIQYNQPVHFTPHNDTHRPPQPSPTAPQNPPTPHQTTPYPNPQPTPHNDTHHPQPTPPPQPDAASTNYPKLHTFPIPSPNPA